MIIFNQIPYDYTVEVRNRFKGLDLIDRAPEELWTEIHDTVQEIGIKNIPIENKCKKAKWLSGEALQIAVKRREAKSKVEKPEQVPEVPVVSREQLPQLEKIQEVLPSRRDEAHFR